MKIIRGGKEDARPRADSASPADLSTLVDGTTDFAAALYAPAARDPGNVFFSPASISVALAMTYAGARGETSAEMERTLRFGALAPARLHAALGAAAAAIGGAPGVEVAIANALFGQKGYGFLPEFQALLAAHYGAGLREVDFAGGAEEARRAINEWVERQTKKKIADSFVRSPRCAHAARAGQRHLLQGELGRALPGAEHHPSALLPPGRSIVAGAAHAPERRLRAGRRR